jgi:hypothetical protein
MLTGAVRFACRCKEPSLRSVRPSGMSSRLAVTAALVALVAAGCAYLPWLGPSPSPTDETRVVAQQRFCGRLDPAPCAEVVAAVTSRFPDMAQAPVAIADLGKDPKALDPGPGRYLVAFVPTAQADDWMWPPTFRVVWGPNGLTVERWREGALPGFFVEQLQAAGVGT